MRFSLLTLIAITSLAGLACAALAKPSGEWLTVVVSLTAIVYVVQVLRCWLLTDGSQATAAGWLLFATAYLMLALGPWTSEHAGRSLLTSQALAAAQQRWLPESRDIDLAFTYTGNTLLASQANSQLTIAVNSNASYALVDSYFQALSAGSPPGASISPAALFHLTGHWLGAWLAGWLGAMIAATLHRRGTAGRASIA